MKTSKEKILCLVILTVVLKYNTSKCFQNNQKKITIYKNKQKLKSQKSLRAPIIKTTKENRDQDLIKNQVKNRIISKIINNKK